VREEEVVVFIVMLFVFAGVVILWMAMSNRRKYREMEHRERLAMIQRGLMPAPESDPVGFEMAADQAFEPPPTRRPSERWRSAGVTFVGLGIALMVMLSITAGEPEVGFGIGGAFAVLGGTLLFNSSHLRRTENRYRFGAPMYPPQRHPHQGPPPPNVAP
jgi:hypothetical protein